MSPRGAPYGSWKSPITSDLVVAGAVSFGQIVCDGADAYWTESRPAEGGRNVIVRSSGARTEDVLPAPYNARSRVHEYGGGAFMVSDGIIYFFHYRDHRLYRLEPGAAPRPITPEAALRYADIVVDKPRARLICVCEDHTAADHEPESYLVALDVHGETPLRVLARGADFYSTPRLSPDGRRLAWLSWNHPNMPWDGTELWLAELAPDGSLRAPQRIAGGEDESVFQPQFGPDGTLYFVSDRTSWWNLYRHRDGRIEAVAPRAAEFGLPQWVFGTSTYGFASEEGLVCAFCEDGFWRLGVIDTASGNFSEIETPYTEIGFVAASEQRVYFAGASPELAPAIVRLNLADRSFETLKLSGGEAIDPEYCSTPQAMRFPTGVGETAHAFFYPPRNRDFEAPEDERPPLLVLTHGGPTAAASSAFNLRLQFWTSRGFAVLDVNYRGSTGYGRAYRERLNGAWGVADVEDCVYGATYLVARGLVDRKRLAIRGGSAGGYTTLCALAFHDLFRAGAVYYGVSDLEALARETHKFEARYLDRLVAPYPQAQELYRQRSPIHRIEGFSAPVIFFQGLDDKVVPPDQTERMVAALREKGIPVAYVPFADEAHGFRRAENIQRALEAELYFYARIFGFIPADDLTPVVIENMDRQD